MKRTIITTILAAACAMGAAAGNDATQYKVYINPGHGGHTSNDRNVVIAPYTAGDPEGYWESNSNLEKGLALRDMLEEKGYTVVMSRVGNTEDDDLNLSTIVALCNNSGADVFFSIHSNATGVSARRNFPLILFRGYDNEPLKPNDKVVATILNQHLLENQATYWTNSSLNVRGDWTFYPSWGTQGLGVLRGNTSTAVLSEGSFHDYIPETYRLMSKDFCWLEAFNFRKAIDEYFDVDGISTGAIIGRINDSRVPREGDYIKFGEDTFATVQGVEVSLYNQEGTLVDVYTTSDLPNGIYCFRDLEPGTYNLKFNVETHYPEELTVQVAADCVSYANVKMGKVRNTAPEVIGWSPVWTDSDEPVLCNTPITLQFNWDMDTELTEAAFSINPPVEGTFSWEDLNYRLKFTPTKAYDISTVYTVTMGTGAAHAGGMTMEEPFSFTFKTTDRNFMDIIGSFPSEGEEVHYKGAVIEFRFDKLPDVTKILNQVTCTDSDGNAVSFNKRGMSNSKAGSAYGYFRIPFAKDLETGKTYRLQISGDFGDKDGITIQQPVDLTFSAVDAGEAHDGVAVDEMAAEGAYTYNEEASTGVTKASAAVDKKEYLFGSCSTSFTYELSTDEGAEVLWSTTPATDAVTVSQADKLGVHIYGDLTANEVYLELTSDVSTRLVKVCDMTFLGWRYIELPMTELEGISTLTGIKLVQRASQMSHSGTFRMDLIEKSTIDGVGRVSADNISVWPNPASDFVVANAGALIASVELYGMDGHMVARTAGNALRVSDVPAGNYLVIVTTASERIVRKIVIKH